MCVCVCVRACVRACVSGHMSPYWSAHDEWLFMKLCMYVQYHTANDVSNFGGDPIKFNLTIIELDIRLATCVAVCLTCVR